MKDAATGHSASTALLTVNSQGTCVATEPDRLEGPSDSTVARRSGNAVYPCARTGVGRMEVIDAEVFATLEDDICRPSVIEEAIRLAMEELAPERQQSTRERLEAKLSTLQRECERLAEAIARGGPLDALLARLTERQAHVQSIQRELAACPTARSPLSLKGLEGRLRDKLDDWRGLLQRNVPEARAVLQTLLVAL